MKKKITGIFALFTFLFVIAMLPSKAVNAAEPAGTAISLGQTVTLKNGDRFVVSLNVTAGQIIYIDRSIYNCHYTETGKYDYYQPEYSVLISETYLDNDDEYYEFNNDIFWFSNYDNNCGSVFYVNKTGIVKFEVSTNNLDGGTVKFVDGAQQFTATQTKATSMGNNVYEFTPILSGVYAFTAKTVDNSYGRGEIGIYTYNGKTIEPIDDRADANNSFCSGFNFETEAATLKAGTTYYILGYAYNSALCTYTEDGKEDSFPYSIQKGFTLSITQSPTVAVNKVTISKATSPKSKKIKVTWKKANGVNGYEISYSLKKNMKGAKTVLVSSAKKTKVITGLKKKKTYYVRIRAYRTVEGNNYFGSYSKKLKVKTK